MRPKPNRFKVGEIIRGIKVIEYLGHLPTPGSSYGRHYYTCGCLAHGDTFKRSQNALTGYIRSAQGSGCPTCFQTDWKPGNKPRGYTKSQTEINDIQMRLKVTQTGWR